MRVAGGNHATLKKWARRWNISTEHFDPDAVRARHSRMRAVPLEEILVRNSTYQRGKLKARLYNEGIKERRCEECGQGENWLGKHMSLILDHINGDATDNRLENLRIACPNCAATFETHCGRNRDRIPRVRVCAECGDEFAPKYRQQRYCSIRCARRNHSREYKARRDIRKVERPPYEQLMRELEETNYSAVGRKYGVSDNAVRKWVRWYERQRKQAAKRWRIGTLRRLGAAPVPAYSGRHRVPEDCETRGKEHDGESRLPRG
jgi:transposase-like protein